MLRDTRPLLQSSEEYFFHSLLLLFSPSLFLKVTLIYAHVLKPSLNLPVARVIKHQTPGRKPRVARVNHRFAASCRSDPMRALTVYHTLNVRTKSNRY